MTLATITDVTARSLRALSDIEKTWAETALEDVLTQIQTRFPDIEAQAVEGSVLRKMVIQVQAAAVNRVLRNPDGLLEETVDDYKKRLDKALSSGELYVSDAEFNRITSASTPTTSSSQAFTISPFSALVPDQPNWWVNIS